MNKILYFYLIICFFIPQILFAQEKIPDLVTDRPDQTESSTTVPLKYFQLETGFFMEINDRGLFREEAFAYNTSLLRYGLLENLELRLGIEYLGERTKTHISDSSYSISGFSPLYTGFKLKIEEENGWKPEIAFLGGLVLPFTAGNDFRPEYTAANIRFSFSHTLSDRISLGYNLGAEWDGDSAIPGYFYSLALGVGLTERLGAFGESYGLIKENGYKEHMLDAGFTYLLSQNFQLDISGGIGLNENATDYFISFGFSYRIPK